MNKSHVAQILNDVLEPTQGMTTDEITGYLSQIATVSITALRGIAGDQYVSDFLTAALNDDSKPAIKMMKKQ